MFAETTQTLLAVSIGKARYSHKLLEEIGEFVVNIPTKELDI